jgi:hypothetical protein
VALFQSVLEGELLCGVEPESVIEAEADGDVEGRDLDVGIGSWTHFGGHSWSLWP